MFIIAVAFVVFVVVCACCGEEYVCCVFFCFQFGFFGVGLLLLLVFKLCMVYRCAC